MKSKEIKQYYPLLIELLKRDIKVKYRKSVLGVLWSVLNPLFMMMILSVVFSTLFKNNVENYPTYIFSGQLIYNFFSEATTSSMSAIVDNRVIKIGICDDDKSFRTLLSEAIRREDSENFIYEYSTGEELIQDEENNLDLLFLDIQLPGITGNKASEIMKKKNKDLILIFISGIYLPTPENFCVQPYRYLLKQSNPSELQKELKTILKYTKEHKGKKYFIAEDDGMYQKIDIDEILYVSIIRRGCEIHILQNGTEKILRTRKRIQEIEEELEKEYFCRIHKSFLVNPKYITEVKKSEVKMENNEILSVSKARRESFEDMFVEYLSYRN